MRGQIYLSLEWSEGGSLASTTQTVAIPLTFTRVSSVFGSFPFTKDAQGKRRRISEGQGLFSVSC